MTSHLLLKRGYLLVGAAAISLGALTAAACDDDDDDAFDPIQTEIHQEEEDGGTSNQSDEGDRTQIPGQGGSGEGGGVPDPPSGSASPTNTTTGTPGQSEGSDQPNVSDDDARTVSDLTAGFQGHVYLVGELIDAVVQEDSAKVDAAQSAVNENTQFIAIAMNSVTGEDFAFTFTDGWAEHIELYRQYVDASLNGNTSEADATRDELSNWAAEFSGVLADGVSDDSVEEGDIQEVLEQHVQHTTDVADAIIAGDPQVVTMARQGAVTMADFAKLLTGITD